MYIRLTSADADEPARNSAVKALTRASGYLRRELAPRLKLRYLPELSFFWDEDVERAMRIEELLVEISREVKGGAPETPRMSDGESNGRK